MATAADVVLRTRDGHGLRVPYAAIQHCETVKHFVADMRDDTCGDPCGDVGSAAPLVVPLPEVELAELVRVVEYAERRAQLADADADDAWKARFWAGVEARATQAARAGAGAATQKVKAQFKAALQAVHALALAVNYLAYREMQQDAAVHYARLVHELLHEYPVAEALDLVSEVFGHDASRVSEEECSRIAPFLDDAFVRAAAAG